MKLKIKFPFVKDFHDYHDIIDEKDQLNDILYDTIKAKEIDFDGRYWAIFYTKKLPSPNVIKLLLKKNGFNFDFDY